MARPVVLVATTDPTMAFALQARLNDKCRELGLKLDACPGGDKKEDKASGAGDLGFGVCAYYSAEVLFDELEKRDPYELADTLVVLDLGARLAEAFEPKALGDEGWHVTANRAGVAVELLLRFPQVFPVFLSPAVPVPQDYKPNGEQRKLIHPQPAKNVACGELKKGNWSGYSSLQSTLLTRHMGKCKEDKSNILPNEISPDALFALTTPLHFVSPLDQGDGLFSVLRRFSRGMRCWFDPTGLRTLVKNHFLGTVFGGKDVWDTTFKQREVLLGRLNKVAVAVDEEREFAMLNAYTAYKFGRRAWVVTTFAEFNENPLWVRQEKEQANYSDVVVLRDIDIRFPDIPDRLEWTTKDHDKPRNQLKSISSDLWRFYPKNIHESDRLGESWRVRVVSSNKNICWVGAPPLGEGGGRYFGLSKPISTLYDLKKLFGCPQKVVSVVCEIQPVKEDAVGGHGAPYSNLAMAESLLQQSRRYENGPVENLIGALLAGESYELLMGMSKTTSLEALLLQHKKEVVAEVEFPGVSHAISIQKRRKDVEAVLQQYTKIDFRSMSMKNMFLSQFWSELRLAYRNGEQFAAAEAANARSLVHGRWMPCNFFGLIEWVPFIDNSFLGVKNLIVKAATSFGAWSLASSLVVGYAWVFYLTVSCPQHNKDDAVSFMPTAFFNDVVLSSITLQPMGWVEHVAKDCECGMTVAILHLGFAYVLFGLLISMLYRKITRG